MTIDKIIKKLKSLENPENVEGMKRFGIFAEKAFGVSAPVLKNLSKEIKKQTENRHKLALELWETKIHEARIIAYLIDDPAQLTSEQMDDWARDFDNWAICDGTCGHFFRKSELSYQKVFEWSEQKEEFIKRAGIVLIAFLAVHDKKADDERFARFLQVIEEKADDERNFVKKAVNWSLRQIGKRSLSLNELAIETAEKIKFQNTKTARWIAADALRELKSEKIRERLLKKTHSENSM